MISTPSLAEYMTAMQKTRQMSVCHGMVDRGTPLFNKYVDYEYKSVTDFDNLTAEEAQFLIDYADPQGLQYGAVRDWVTKLTTKVNK